MSHEKVARLRQLMSEAVPRKPEPSALEAQVFRQFRLYEVNCPTPVLVSQSPRARAEREIERIANWYGWSGEVLRALDSCGAHCIEEIGDDAIDALLERMQRLERCVQEGLDPPDSPPAR